MKHSIVYKRSGTYGAFPILQQLPDGRITVGISLSHFRDHHGIGKWTVLVSKDKGKKWEQTTDFSLPATWPGTNARERGDRFASVMPDGSYLCAGMIGVEAWPPNRLDEAKKCGFSVEEYPMEYWGGKSNESRIIVQRPTLFVQRSKDRGKTWDRKEWDVPGFTGTAFSRSCRLEDGTILVPIYGSDKDNKGQCFVWRGSNEGRTWRMHHMGQNGNETAFVEIEPGMVLALSRDDLGVNLIQRWSNDGGINWTQALDTKIFAPNSPPHLLKLVDGRILATYGYRAEPMGIRSVFSNDLGETWDVKNTVVLREDGGFPSELHNTHKRSAGDVGYAHSAQLPNGSIISVYYITLADRITHSAATHWNP